MRIREMIGKVKEKMFGKKEPKKDTPQNVQNGRETAKTEKAGIPSDGAEKAQEQAHSGAEQRIQETAELYGMTAEELTERLTQSAQEVAKVFETFGKRLTDAAEYFLMNARYCCGIIDKWELEKWKMPNNERRRRGIPMVRRRAYIQIEKNRRKKARKK